MLGLTAMLNKLESKMLHSYVGGSEPSPLHSVHVPVTLKHFEILAHLGRAPVCSFQTRDR